MFNFCVHGMTRLIAAPYRKQPCVIPLCHIGRQPAAISASASDAVRVNQVALKPLQDLSPALSPATLSSARFGTGDKFCINQRHITERDSFPLPVTSFVLTSVRSERKARMRPWRVTVIIHFTQCYYGHAASSGKFWV